MNNYIYILHEYGAPTHYHSLKVLAEQHNFQLKFHVFNYLLDKGLIYKVKCFIKHPYNVLSDLWFLATLNLRQPVKIVIGIAPYNNHLPLLMRLMRKHEVYYHTSYSCWDGARYVHQPKAATDINKWKTFTSKYVKHVFAVSEWTKKQMILNGYITAEKISVVNHSYTRLIEANEHQSKTLNFICVAALNESKGISELLHIFSLHPEAQIMFVGDGPLKEKVKDYANRYSNIKYAGYINGSNNIIPLYKSHSFLILNSHKTSSWEELFGMVIIEGMACGCVPITTNHPGPQEIIANNADGFICQEGRILEGIEKAINMPDEIYLQMRVEALNKGRKYHCDQMASRWSQIFS